MRVNRRDINQPQESRNTRRSWSLARVEFLEFSRDTFSLATVSVNISRIPNPFQHSHHYNAHRTTQLSGSKGHNYKGVWVVVVVVVVRVIAIAVTGRLRPSFYTYSVRPILRLFVRVPPPSPLPRSPLLWMVRLALIDSVFFSNISHMNLSDVLQPYMLVVCSYICNRVMHALSVCMHCLYLVLCGCPYVNFHV